MAVLYGQDFKFTLNSQNMSDHVQAVGLSPVGAELDVTAFGTTTWNSFISGLGSYQMTVVFFQDYAASAVDSLLWPLFRTVVTWSLLPTSSAVGTSNPMYSGSVLINQLDPANAKIGDLVMQSLTWKGTGALVRATS